MSENLFAGVNSIINSVNENVALSCDAKCQEDRYTRQLYDKYLTAKNNVKTGEKQLDQAEEKYFVYTKGEKWYNNFRTQKWEDEGRKVAEYLQKQFKQREKLLKSLEADVTSTKLYASQLLNLKNTYKQEISDLEKKIKTLETKTNVNHRLTSYDEDAIERKTKYISQIRIMYYVFVVAYAIIQLGYLKNFRKLEIWITLVFMLIIPHVIGLIIKLLRYLRIKGLKYTLDDESS